MANFDSLSPSPRSEAEKALEKAIKNKSIEFSTNGHFYYGTKYAEFEELFRLSFFLAPRMADEEISNILKLCKQKEFLVESPISLGPLGIHQCGNCGEYVEWNIEGRTLKVSTECPYPAGLPDLELELNVPSGKIVLGNDFRKAFRIFGDYNVNTQLGIHKTSWKYQEIGMIHCFVGNTCPGIYQRKKNHSRLLIGVAEDEGKEPFPGYKEIGGICTDLWWYCAVDYDQFVLRSQREPGRDEVVVKVRPGVYKFTHIVHRLPNEYHRPAVYTAIERVRESDPVEDFVGKFNQMNFTAGQVIRKKLVNYGDLYSCKNIADVTIENYHAAACHVLIVSGDSDDYHPNGFWLTDPDASPNDPDVEIPLFCFPYDDYPLYDSCRLAQMAGVAKCLWKDEKEINNRHFNESFVKLAFNLVRQLLLYGSDKRDHKGKLADENIENVRLAKRFFLGLSQRYPEYVPDDCEKFLSERA